MLCRAERPIILFAALAMSGAAAIQAADADAALTPFTATFTVEWRGMSAGTSTLELTREGNGYVYSSRNVARGIFKLALPGAITQTSRFTLVNGTVTPLSYIADDGTRKTSRDVSLSFDWNTLRATGTAEDKPVDIAIHAGVQDPLSVQIALMRELIAGRSPTRFELLDKDEIKEYQYAREGEETLDSAIGKVDTIIYSSQRTGSTRVTRLWLAPSRGYLPVRAEQTRRGKQEFFMEIRSAEGERGAGTGYR